MKRMMRRLAAPRHAWHTGWLNSSVRRWVGAWVTELVEMLPPALTARMGTRNVDQVVTWPLPVDCQPGRPTFLLLAPTQVMAQRISLPLAAIRNLREVLTYEIDKYTPYTADQVHFVARVLHRHASSADVQLVAIARTALQTMIAACRERGLHLLALDAQGVDGERLRIDLLPPGTRRVLARSARLDRWLWVGCCVATLALAAAYLERRQAEVQAMQREVAVQRNAVQHLLELRNTLDTTLDASAYLARLKAQRPSLSWLLADLTLCLGRDTWVEHLQVHANGQVTFTGQSAQASALPTQLKGCQTFVDARFQGAILVDQAGNRDQFTISAQLTQEPRDASAKP